MTNKRYRGTPSGTTSGLTGVPCCSSKGNFFLFLILFSLEHKAHLYKRQGGGKPATWVAGGRRSERAPGGRRSERALSARARPASAVRCPALPPAAHPLPCLQPFFFDPCCAAVNVKGARCAGSAAAGGRRAGPSLGWAALLAAAVRGAVRSLTPAPLVQGRPRATGGGKGAAPEPAGAPAGPTHGSAAARAPSEPSWRRSGCR